ncbi:MAG: alcohol dehydrogenase catalytic domain-containing protein [Nitrososphaerota archaeon]
MSHDKMHAVVIYGKENFKFEEVTKPKPGPEEVLVKIGRCGICAADPKIFHGLAYFSPIVYKNAPIVAGHEFVGEVIELGPGAAEKYGLEVGDKAIMENIVPCWECYYCKRGFYNLCDRHYVPGVRGVNGGWAEYMLYPRGSIIHKVPRELPWEAAVLIEPLACAIHGVQRVGINFDDVVVILGVGPIGLLMLEATKLKNPKMIIVASTNDNRLRVAKELGADLAINPNKEDLVEIVKKETNGIGADVVLEAAGTPRAIEDAVNLLRKRGRLLVFGVYSEKTTIDFSIISDIKELEIFGAHLGLYAYPSAIRLLQEGHVNYQKIVTHNIPLKDWKNAIEIAEKRLEGSIKVTMTP